MSDENNLNNNIQNIPKKGVENLKINQNNENSEPKIEVEKIPKKRGRKPKK